MKKIKVSNLNVFVFLIILFITSSYNKMLAHHTSSFGFGSTAGPILSSPASTLLKGHWSAGYRLEYLNLDEISKSKLITQATKRVFPHSTSFFLSNVFGLSYGVTDDFTLSLRLPVTSEGGLEDAILRNGIGRTSKLGTASGLGDITLSGQYRFLNLKNKKIEAALIGGVDIPSGVHHIKDDNGNLFGDDHQPGKGSWDPLLGIAITKRCKNKLSFDTNYFYNITVRGNNDYKAGNSHNYNAAITYRLLDFHNHTHENMHKKNYIHTHPHPINGSNKDPHSHKHFHAHSHDSIIYNRQKNKNWLRNIAIDTIIELNGEWKDKQSFNNIADNNSGGNSLFVSPGIRLVWRDWATYISVGIPAYQGLNGIQSKTTARLIYGVSRAF